MAENRIEYGVYSWNFIAISGHPDLPGMQLKEIVKDGVDGAAFKELQFRGEDTPIYLSTLVQTYAEMIQFIADMKNLQGTQITLYDSSAVAYAGVVVRRVQHTRSKFVLKPSWLAVSYASGWRLNFMMVVKWPYGSF